MKQVKEIAITEIQVINRTGEELILKNGFNQLLFYEQPISGIEVEAQVVENGFIFGTAQQTKAYRVILYVDKEKENK